MSEKNEIEKAVEARFWAKVDKNGPVPAHMPNLGKCWVWKGSTKGYGYGQFYCPKSVKAHRYSWGIHNSKVSSKIFVLHRCDNRLCVNPSHLFLGNNSDNMRDCAKKKRHINTKKTHCIRGHAFDSENTYFYPDGHRGCRACVDFYLRRGIWKTSTPLAIETLNK